ncbi:MAG: dihydrolipoamide dehydrogenase [Flavobacteriales bacterium]|jgi:dihydrolipoamide dehydrogenase
MKKYDVCIIGAGPSGIAAAMRAIDFKKSVLLIEKDKIGGAGIFNGALSSKTMWELSEKVTEANETIYQKDGLKFELPWEHISEKITEVTKWRSEQYTEQLDFLNNLPDTAFTLTYGAGYLLNNHEVEITKADGKETIWAENIVIAVGSTPRKLPNINIDEKHIVTSDGIHDLKEYPKSLVILGAGVIGCEFATMFSSFGKTKVFLIDRANRVLPFEDHDISDIVTDNLRQKGVVVHNEANFERMEVRDGMVEYEISYPQGMTQVIRVEKALVSVGRVPAIHKLGLENTGVTLSPRGNVGEIDTQTNIPNIYVVGDVSGHIALVNVGEIEARHAIEKMYGNKLEQLSYDNVCTIMFLHPEVAAIGMNEQDAQKRNIDYKLIKFQYANVARAIAMGKTKGFFKIMVTNDDEMKVLGMRVVGAHASSSIQAIGLLIKTNQSIAVLAELVHPHPSIIEGIQEAVRILIGQPLMRSGDFKNNIDFYKVENGVKIDLLNASTVEESQ